MIEYKVVELSVVTDESIEEVLNHWTESLDCQRVAVRDDTVCCSWGQ